MSCKFFLNGLMGAALALGVVAVQAGTVVSLNSQIGGAYVNTSKYSGTGGGGFSGKLTGTGADAGHDQDPLLAYCVDLDNTFAFGTYTDKFVVKNASSYFSDSTKVDRLANLFTWAASDSANWFNSPNADEKKARSSGIQLAVWEIVYDTSLDLFDGSFKVNTTGPATDGATLGYAQTLLSNANTAQANRFNIYILDDPRTSGTRLQDQLFWEDAITGKQITTSPTSTPIPEPVSLALVAVALTGLALTRRRG